ncbi:MAG: hypothetical protein JKY25_00120 [Robiginitomaculum sp.]|nr:hypothetical protein [Robiginitomaculum sp.]
MRTGLFITAFLVGAVWATPASAQVIAQTPRPDIPAPEQDEVVETLKPTAHIGHSRKVIQTARAGALLFASFDANSDYVIDRQEVGKGIAQAFKQADRDGDDYLSLVELEGWRVAALGSEHAAPSNFAFAPNFARGVTREMFTQVLQRLADRLDKDDQSEMDGRIALGDLLKDYRPQRHRQQDNCIDKVREERRRGEQNCRNSRR